MEALVITLREGVEAALVVGLILAYLNRHGWGTLSRYVYAGLGLAVTASIVGAFGLSRLGIDVEDPLTEGILMAAAAGMVATLVLWMWRAARNVHRVVEARLETITARTSARRGWGLLAFTFLMVAREGIEVVIFLAALSLTTAAGYVQVMGGVIGLALAALFGYLLVRGSVRIDFRRFFGMTSLVLALLVVRLLAGSIHELTEAGVLSTAVAGETIVDFLVGDAISIGILIALIVLPVVTLLPSLRDRATAGGLAGLWQAHRWQVGVIVGTLVIAMVLASSALG